MDCVSLNLAHVFPTLPLEEFVSLVIDVIKPSLFVFFIYFKVKQLKGLETLLGYKPAFNLACGRWRLQMSQVSVSSEY